MSTFLDLPNGIPSHDTFGRVLRWLDVEQVKAQFIVWMFIGQFMSSFAHD